MDAMEKLIYERDGVKYIDLFLRDDKSRQSVRYNYMGRSTDDPKLIKLQLYGGAHLTYTYQDADKDGNITSRSTHMQEITAHFYYAPELQSTFLQLNEYPHIKVNLGIDPEKTDASEKALPLTA